MDTSYKDVADSITLNCSEGSKNRESDTLKGCGLVFSVWALATALCDNTKRHTYFCLNSSFMSTIQYIDKERRELLEDLREIACSYQPLKETDPQKYRRTILREMNDYLHRIKQHPVFSEFCELTHINQDEFMNDILQQIKKEIF